MFITFEGLDGSGKSTQAKLLYNYLREQNIKTRLTREPGGTTVGNKLRSILFNTNVDPIAELLLFSADRAQHLAEVINPSLADGKVVICDRYFHSMITYQGYGRNLSTYLISILLKATNVIEPDLVILLDMPAEEALARSIDNNRMDMQSIEFYERVRKGYFDLIVDNWLLLDATQAIETIHQKIVKEVNL